MKPTFVAYVSDGTNWYFAGNYKRFGWARRAIATHWPYFGLGRPMKHWAISRDSNMGLEGRHLNAIIAQSRDWPHKSHWVRPS